MYENDAIIYDIWLSQFSNGNSRIVAKLLEFYETPQNIYENRGNLDSSLQISEGIKDKLKYLKIEDALQIYEKCDRLGITILSYRDKERYPKRLIEIYDFPLVLYSMGEELSLDDYLPISVVGTRNPSNYAIKATEYIVSGLAKLDSLIISGLAVGIDTVAHSTALQMKAKTVAVVGCGLDIEYPAQNKNLRSEILKTGMIISEYPPGVHPAGWHFPIRNRILSGLSVGVLVMEGSMRSGSLITAKHASEQGRDVYALPGDIFSPKADGTFDLIKNGAIPVRQPMDIIENYLYEYPEFFAGKKIIEEKNIKTEDKNKKNSKVLTSFKKTSNLEVKIRKTDIQKRIESLSGDKKKICIILLDRPYHIEELSKNMDMDISKLLPVLTELEMEGFVMPQAGRMYKIAIED